MKIAIQQPQFFPWEGYWHKVRSCDVFVFYAGVQYQKQNYANRVKMNKTWMVLPVHAPLGTVFKDVVIDPRHVQGLARRIQQTYACRRRRYGDRLDGLVSLMGQWRKPMLLDFLVETHIEMQKFLQSKPILIVDDKIREGTPEQKVKSCLADLVPLEVEMLSSEAQRGWYDALVSKVWYQQKPVQMRDESFLARIVDEENPDTWEGWGWT